MIQEGASAFIRRQYSTIGLLAVVGTLVVAAVIAIVETPEVADTSVAGLDLGIYTGVAFLVGAICSMASGVIGMWVSVRANLPTAAAAQTSLVGAVQTAMRGGAVSGFLVVALSLLGVWGIFTALRRDRCRDRRMRPRSSSSASGSAPPSSRCSRSSAVVSTRRPPTSEPTWSARSRRASPRTIPAMPRSSPTSSATTSVTAPAAAPTSSNRPLPRTSAR